MLGLQRFVKCKLNIQRTISAVIYQSYSYKSNLEAESVDDNSNLAKKTKSRPIVAAAFQNLNDDVPLEPKSTKANLQSIDEAIIKAKTVANLLSINDNLSAGQLERKHALKIVSILAEWSSTNKIKLSDFESDKRFIKICTTLGRPITTSQNNSYNKNSNNFIKSDLNTVLGVAGDDEAARLVSKISLPQMVKVISTLAQRKRRSTPLLRSLAYNISSSAEILNLKHCADILYAMAALNFQDTELFSKLVADIHKALKNNKIEKSAPIGSIVTSFGILKFRDIDLMESIVNWYISNSAICRNQDLNGLFMTLAILNYQSPNIEQLQEKFNNILVKEEYSKSVEWLNFVWSLALLGIVNNTHLDSVLRKSFIDELLLEVGKNGILTPNIKMKILNLNGYSQHVADNYNGSHLDPDSNIFDVPIAQNKSKQIITNSMLDAFKSLVLSGNNVKSLVDTKMGFVIDTYCVFDDKRNPLNVNDENSKNAIRVAVMIHDYHEMCHGPQSSISGLTKLYINLLEKTGYKVLSIPYNEFNVSDKLLKRVQYLEVKLKKLIIK